MTTVLFLGTSTRGTVNVKGSPMLGVGANGPRSLVIPRSKDVCSLVHVEKVHFGRLGPLYLRYFPRVPGDMVLMLRLLGVPAGARFSSSL